MKYSILFLPFILAGCSIFPPDEIPWYPSNGNTQIQTTTNGNRISNEQLDADRSNTNAIQDNIKLRQEKKQIENNQKLIDAGFVLYKSTQDNFQVFLPEEPKMEEIQVLQEELRKIRHYTATSLSDIRYRVFIPVFDKPWNSNAVIEEWLKGAYEGRMSNSKNSTVKEDDYLQFKGLRSRQYTYQHTAEDGSLLTTRVIGFVSKGQPMELTMTYIEGNNSDTYWNEFLESFIP